ncbi:hypothetical protein [Actinomadura macrotermitis]|uniref:hypothetical protein n=1 Tax=Actinomadura macrotermitis TaxID=2585200 RepID=UPI0012952E02|nr:hypothetical protein [Actinomadura macrotermitis]
MAQGLTKVKASAQGASTALGRLQGSTVKAGQALSGVQGKAQQAAASVGRVKAQAAPTGSALQKLGTQARSAGTGVVSLQKGAAQSGKAVAGLKKDLTSAGTEATKSGKSLGAASKGVKGLGPAGKLAGGGLKAVGAGFKSALGPAGLILMLLQPFLEKLIEAVTNSKTFKKIVSGAMKAVSASVKWLKDAGKVVFDWIKKNWPLLLAILTGPIGIAVLVIKKNWGKIKEGATAVKDWIVGKFTGMVGFFQNLPGKLARGLGNVNRTLFNKGRDLIMGLIHGITSMAGNLLNAIKNSVTDKIPGFIKKAMGINSPSVLMMGLGHNIGEGMAIGVAKGGEKVDTAMKGLVMQPAQLYAHAAASRKHAIAGMPARVGAVSGGLHVENYYEAERGDARRTAEELLWLAKGRG